METFSTYLTVVAVLIGIIIKVYMDLAYKTVRKIGKGKIMDIILLVNELTYDTTLEDFKEMLVKFKKKHTLEMDMKTSTVDITDLFAIQKALHSPKISKEIQEYKRKKEYGIIKNKKRWNQILHDIRVDRALDGIINTLITRYEIQAQAANKKVNVDQITTLINTIKSDTNLKKNRATRKKIEVYTEQLRTQEKEADLTKIQKKLHEIFKVKQNDPDKHADS